MRLKGTRLRSIAGYFDEFVMLRVAVNPYFRDMNVAILRDLQRSETRYLRP